MMHYMVIRTEMHILKNCTLQKRTFSHLIVRFTAYLDGSVTLMLLKIKQ